MRKWKICNFLRHWYLVVLKSLVFVRNTVHFHNEIDLASSEGLDGMKVDASSFK